MDVDKILRVAAMLVLASVWRQAAAETVVYRNVVDARSWAVLADPDEELSWAWEKGAVSATLTASNLVTGACASEEVVRGSSPDGACAIPLDVEGRQLIDVTIVQSNGSSGVSTNRALLAVGNDATLCLDATSDEFVRLDGPRIYSWSDLWDEGSSGASSAVLSTSVTGGSLIGSWNLPATSGFSTMSPKNPFARASRTVTASVAFDETTYLTANLRLSFLGVLIMFR